MYPYPLPPSALDFKVEDESATVYSSPALISVDGKFNIAVTSSDILMDFAKHSTYELNVENRFQKGLETFLEQKNLLPIYPSLNPIDLSKMDAMSYKLETQPDILISRSNISQQLLVSRGVVCMTVPSSASNNEFKSFGHLKIADADKVSTQLMSDC